MKSIEKPSNLNQAVPENMAEADSTGAAWVFSSYLYLLYFSVVFQLLLWLSGLVSLVGVRDSLVYTLPWLLVVILLPAKWVKPFLMVVGLVLFPLALTNIGYFLLYGQEMSQGVLYSIFETNPGESTEFISSYFRWWMLLLAPGLAIPAVWLWRRIKVKTPGKKQWALVMFLALFPVIEPVAKYWQGFNTLTLEKVAHRMEGRLTGVNPWQFVLAWQGYRKNLETVQLLANRLKNGQTDNPPVSVGDNLPEKATFVLVIGESTNSQRMGIYGYPRDTTPKLSAMKQHLYAFDDVITARPYTIEALAQALSFADQNNPEGIYQGHNVLSLMRSAGFKTWWISNQQSLSGRNTLLTAISSQADKSVLLNNNRMQSSTQLDDVVMEPFQQALLDNTPRKFIVVHLMGTHFGYDHRYSDDYALFDDQTAPTIVHDADAAMYNEYDNAILYHDKILAEIFQRFLAADPYGVSLYFSDHGEEVYDQRDFHGRNEYDPSTAMYTIPFFMVPSESYRKSNELSHWNNAVHRQYSNADVIHTLCELASVKFRGCDLSKSVVSKNFVAQKRLIGDPAKPSSLKDFDVLFPEHDWVKYDHAPSGNPHQTF